jgi:hypothetical protein
VFGYTTFEIIVISLCAVLILSVIGAPGTRKKP